MKKNEWRSYRVSYLPYHINYELGNAEEAICRARSAKEAEEIIMKCGMAEVMSIKKIPKSATKKIIKDILNRSKKEKDAIFGDSK